MTEAASAPAAPPRGLIAIGSGCLGLEALVTLLATPAVISLDRGHVSLLEVAALVTLFVLLVYGSASVRRSWGKTFGGILQVLVFATGFITWPMFAVGVIFGSLWIYYLRLWNLPAQPTP